MSALLVLAALLAGSVEEEQAELNEKIQAEKSLWDALKNNRTDLVSGLDWLERSFRQSTARAIALQKSATALHARAENFRAEAANAQAVAAAKEAELGPRLTALYRLQKEDRLSRLISARDFGTLVKRERGLSALVSSDLRELEELAVISRYQHLTAARLERLLETAQTVEGAVKLEQELARARRTKFLELLAITNAEEKRVSRVVAELKREEQQLASFVGEMKSAETSAFRMRRGHLPAPVPGGRVEVGFGKVVNPRFNTVTVQKGLDIRAALGAKVVSVGEGTVAFAGWLKGYGNMVIIDHGGGYHSLYAHLGAAAVEAGNEVQEGEEIAEVGDTGSLKGAFLYFEIRKVGQAIDPAPWLEGD